jgi:ribonuclease HI/uncharacterized phage-like protein YoqJ
MKTVAYTDGACLGNPGPGGWAWAVPGGQFAAGCEARSTNQRMEIAAALDALRSLPGSVEVVSDSTYVVNCFRDRWWAGWIKRGWLNSAKKPVANRDLWEPLIELYQERGGAGQITFRWVKGHSGDVMNDLVDRLAVEAANRQQPRSGDEPPTTLGPADQPGPGAGAARGDELAGHPLAVFGPKPPDLGGWDNREVRDALRDRLREIFAAKAELHDDLHIVSGLRLGTEMCAVEAALELKLPVDVVLPWPDPQLWWPEPSRRFFDEMLPRVDHVKVLQRRTPATRAQAGLAISRCEAWIARRAAEAILVWDGVNEIFKGVHRMLEDHLGADVWVIDPAELTPGTRRGAAGRDGRRR